MNPQRFFGIILLTGGIMLFIIGLSSSHSAADQISNTLTGRFTDNTVWFIAGGIVGAIAGLAMLMLGSRGRKA